MKVLKIRKLKNGKYKLILEDNSTLELYDEVILKNNILYTKEITDELLKKINEDNNYYSYYNRTLKYLNTKMRSTKEIEKYLDKFELTDNEKNSIISKLKNIGLLNDSVFTKAFINDKIYLSNIGPYKIKRELLEHDIDEHEVDKYLSEIDNNIIKDKIKKYIAKKIKGNNKLSKYQLKNKIVNDLINNGYDKDDINEELALFTIEENNSILEKEYRKIYSRLSKKYQGPELSFRVVNKLMQKGFLKQEIEEMMEDNI